MEFSNSKGNKYYLHSKVTTIGRNKASVTTYFFVKDKNGTGSPATLPVGYTVKETRTGLPVIKKI